MSLSARAIAVLAALLALSGLLFALLLGTGQRPDPARAQSVPVVMSDNIETVAQLPGTTGISGVFSRSAPFFYVSGAESLTVFDVTDPEKPVLKGKLLNAIFENEAMTYGERRLDDGSIQRFVLVGNDLVQQSPEDPDPRNVQSGEFGKELIIVDVTNPSDPEIIGRTPSTGPDRVTTSTHTVACMNPDCSVAYSAGEGVENEKAEDGYDGTFSILDLGDLTAPKQIGEAKSPAAESNPVFKRGSGHHWWVDRDGLAWHAGSGGTAAFDISDPLDPQPLNGTDENGTKSPFNDFIHHNSQRPNAERFSAGDDEFSVANGNVALITEEDYANDSDGAEEVECSKAGSFQAWSVPDLDADAYESSNPDREADKGTMGVLDTIQAPSEAGTPVAGAPVPNPVGGFCSAHWFDYHQSGTVAIGHYQQGMRLIDVRDARNLEQIGYFAGGATQVWDAYWVPERNEDGTAKATKTNLIYTVDVVRGMDVLRVNGLPDPPRPGGDDDDDDSGSGGGGGGGSTGGGEGSGGGSSSSGAPDASAPAAPGTGTQRAASESCAAPRSTFAKGARASTRGLTLKGTARPAPGCKVDRVFVAVGRKIGNQCRFLQASGRFGARRSCLRTQYLRASGTTAWTLNKRASLPGGSYLMWSRAVDASGAVERKAKSRNLLTRRIGTR